MGGRRQKKNWFLSWFERYECISKVMTNPEHKKNTRYNCHYVIHKIYLKDLKELFHSWCALSRWKPIYCFIPSCRTPNIKWNKKCVWPALLIPALLASHSCDTRHRLHRSRSQRPSLPSWGGAHIPWNILWLQHWAVSQSLVISEPIILPALRAHLTRNKQS